MSVEEISQIMEMLSMINTKIDQLSERIENIPIQRKNNSKKEWTLENYKKSILVKFDFNKQLIEFIKSAELGGIWNNSLKAWLFPKSIENDVIDQITENFPNWVFIDLRKN
jgi:hypothetical protein